MYTSPPQNTCIPTTLQQTVFNNNWAVDESQERYELVYNRMFHVKHFYRPDNGGLTRDRYVSRET